MSHSRATINEFIHAAQRILQESGPDPHAIADRIIPLMQRIVWDDALFDPEYLDPPNEAHPRARYVHHLESDDSLQIYVVEFAPGTPTPVHDHMTWGFIGICGGAQQTARYERLDGGSEPGKADLRLIENRILERGEVYPLIAPSDIHRIETVGSKSSYSLHVIGGDLSRQDRHVFDVDTGTVTPFTGRSM